MVVAKSARSLSMCSLTWKPSVSRGSSHCCVRDLRLVDVAAARGVEHLHAPTLAQDPEAVELADRLRRDVRCENMLLKTKP
jgi:hypothetical protein